MRRLLLLLLLLARVAAVHVPAWRAWSHALVPASSPRGAAPAGLFSESRGNLMFWKLHKVGGTTLRYVLLRRVAEANLTLGVLGCTHQREPLRAHLSASHVVCAGATRDYALAALLGRRHSEARLPSPPAPPASPAQAALVREPAERALSAYYFIGMSERRSAAVNALRCGFNVSFMGRDLSLERREERLAFARHGLQALQRCALASAAGPAAHVRAFQPQWAYWARDARASAAHAAARARHGAFFVGVTERYNETLALLAAWLRLPLAAVRVGSVKRAYGGARPRLADWAAEEVAALRAAVAEEAAWHGRMMRIYAALVGGYEGGAEGLAAAAAEVAAINTPPLSEAERRAERAWRRRRRRDAETSA